MYVKSPQYENREIEIITHTDKCLHGTNVMCDCTDRLKNVKQFKYLGVIVDNRF